MGVNNKSTILSHLADLKIIPVIRGDSPDNAYKAIGILENVGYGTVEITMTVPGALELIQDLTNNDNHLLIGAGTVFNEKEAEDCILSGAQYIVSPLIVDGVPEICQEAGIPCIMSGLTPTEIYESWKRGSSAVKIFPANAMGGPKYIKALKTIFPQIPLVPTGGVNLNNMNDYLESGASFVGVGSDLVNNQMLEGGNFDGVAELGRKFLMEVDNLKNGGSNYDLF